MEEIHNTEVQEKLRDPPLESECDAPADPPLDTVCNAIADPPIDTACHALVNSPLQNVWECWILGSSIQDLWEYEQCLMLLSWRNGTKTQLVMDIWLKYMENLFENSHG
jgi:hypothetical protein